MNQTFLLQAPSRLRHGNRTAHLGETVYLALAVLNQAGGRLSAADLCRAVWGVDGVGTKTLRSLLNRITHKLRSVEHPRRVCLDGEDVMVC